MIERMARPGGLRWALACVALCAQAGCATWHDNLMPPAQLVQADCQALAQEEAKLADNARATTQASYIGAVGAVLTAVVGAISASEGGPDPTRETVNQHVEGVGQNETRSQDFEERRQLVQQLRVRKGCV